jgi:glucose-6-phosphate isomerase
MQIFEPFVKQLDLQTSILEPVECVLQRRLSDMLNFFVDEGARERIEKEEGDRLIYEVFAVKLPEEEGHLSYGTTIIYPGTVGEEFHFTKGHFHKLRNRAEVYLCISGVCSSQLGASNNKHR